MERLSLYKATQLATLESHIDTETGEIDMQAFNESKLALRDKQLAVLAFAKNQRVMASMQIAAGKELQAQGKAKEERAAKMEANLLATMQQHGITEVTADDFSFSAKIKKNPPKVVIDDESKLDDFVVTKEVKSIDKKALKDAINNGGIDGAHLKQSERLEIK